MCDKLVHRVEKALFSKGKLRPEGHFLIWPTELEEITLIVSKSLKMGFIIFFVLYKCMSLPIKS